MNNADMAKEDRLTSARKRGLAYTNKEFHSIANLTLSIASQFSGQSSESISTAKNDGLLYALSLGDKEQDCRYPAWQFKVHPVRLQSVLQLLIASELSCWAIHNFLMRPHVLLDGISPSEALSRSHMPIKNVVDVVRARLDLHQGAI